MLISTWSPTTVALGGRDSTCVASWVYRSAEQGVRIQPVLLCRRLPAQRSKALSCEEQVETARRVWEEKAMRMWAWTVWTILSIYALHLTTNVYIYIYIYVFIYFYGWYIYIYKVIKYPSSFQGAPRESRMTFPWIICGLRRPSILPRRAIEAEWWVVSSVWCGLTLG